MMSVKSVLTLKKLDYTCSGTVMNRVFKRAFLTASLFGLASHSYANDSLQPVQETQNLSTIVVTASGHEQDIKNAPASISVLTQEDFKYKRINSIADALTDIEGVDISSTAGKTGGLNIRMRGMDSEYTLILVDGRRQNSTGDITPNGFGESNTSFIPPLSAIERIEVIRGPMSTLYGSDAMGGVVNIITKKVADEWTGSIKLDTTLQKRSSDFGDQRSADLYLSGPIISDLFGVQLRARKWERDASNVSYIDQANSEIELSMGNNPTKADIETVGLRLSLTPHPDHDLWIDAEQTEQWYENNERQLGTLGADGGYGPSQEYQREKYLIAHNWRSPWGSLESSLSQNNTETIGRLIPARAQGLSVAINPRLLKSEDTIFDTKFTGNFASHNFTVGGQWWDASILDGLRENKEINFTQIGLFAEDTWSIRDDVAVTLGLRYDDHDTFGDFITPRAYVVWNTNDYFTIKGGVSEGYKAPRLERLTNGIYNVGGQGRNPIFGSTSLKPETSTNTEFGFVFDNLDNWKVSVTGFYSKVDDKIVTGLSELNCNTGNKKTECEDFMASIGTPWVMSGRGANLDNWNVTRPINAEKATIKGLEFNTHYTIFPGLISSLNYTWSESELDKNTADAIPVVDTPKHIANAQLTWQADDHIDLWARAEYRSERLRYLKAYSSYSANEKATYDAFGDYKAYTLLHMGANFGITPNVDFGIGLYNVLDKDFMSYELVPGITAPTYTNRYNNSQEGRRVQLSTTFRF